LNGKPRRDDGKLNDEMNSVKVDELFVGGDNLNRDEYPKLPEVGSAPATDFGRD
jgi:hypothetical protein